MTKVSALPYVWQTIICSLLLVHPLHASFEYDGVGWAAASANIRVVGNTNLDRFHVNPSLMAGQFEPQLGVGFHRPFSSLDLAASNLAVAWCYRKIPLLSRISYFGDECYAELCYQTALAYKLSETIHLGGLISTHQLSVGEEYVKRSAAASLSMSLLLNEKIMIGTVLERLIQYGAGEGELPQRFLMGMAYTPGSIQLLAAFRKEGALTPDIQLGLVLEVGTHLEIAMGFQDQSQSYSAGWRLNLSKLSIHYSWVGHPFLPASHGLGLDVKLP